MNENLLFKDCGVILTSFGELSGGPWNCYYQFLGCRDGWNCFYKSCKTLLDHQQYKGKTYSTSYSPCLDYTCEPSLAFDGRVASNNMSFLRVSGQTYYAVGGQHLHPKQYPKLGERTSKTYHDGVYLFGCGDEIKPIKKLFDGRVKGQVDGLFGFSEYDSSLSFIKARGEYRIYARCNLSPGTRYVQCYTMDENFENGKMQPIQMSPKIGRKENIYYFNVHYIEEIDKFVAFAPCYRESDPNQTGAGIYLFSSDDGIRWKKLDRVFETGFLNVEPHGKGSTRYKNSNHICNGLLDNKISGCYDVFIQNNYYQYVTGDPTTISKHSIAKNDFLSYVKSA
jgi:hypothetical protein